MDVKQIRTDLGLTQQQLSAVLGCHTMTVSKWERGVLRPRPWDLAMLEAFRRAVQADDGIGPKVYQRLLRGGYAEGLYLLLRTALEPDG